VVTESTPVSYLQLQDLDKLQKEAEMYQKENERLQTEVQLMKARANIIICIKWV